MAWPIVRGVMTLGHAMTLGFRALRFSANVAIEDIMQEDWQGDSSHNASAKFEAERQSSKHARKLRQSAAGWPLSTSSSRSAFFIFMYKYLPLLAATELKKIDPALGGQIVFNLVDGVIRLGCSCCSSGAFRCWKDIRRVYEYHGAEHKTVFAFENGDPLETAAVQKYSTYHPRCGTSFLMTVMLISIGCLHAGPGDDILGALCRRASFCCR